MKKNKLIAIILILTVNFLAFSASGSSKSRPIVRDIIAAGTNNASINISWTLPTNPNPKIKNLLLFRSTKPIDSYYAISEFAPLATLEPQITFYADDIDNYLDYYYAVVATTETGVYDIVIPSINSTVTGAHLKLPTPKTTIQSTASAKEKIYASDGIRETPLPYLDLIESQNRKPLKMSDKAKLAAARLGKSDAKKEIYILEPHIFEDDLVSPEGGDGFVLFEILRTTFIQKNYKEAAEQLERLVATNCSNEVKIRATFYLGEAYYYSSDYKTATTNFLKVYNFFPGVSKRWIDSSLDLFAVPKD